MQQRGLPFFFRTIVKLNMVHPGNFILAELTAVDGRNKGYDKNSHLGAKEVEELDVIEHLNHASKTKFMYAT